VPEAEDPVIREVILGNYRIVYRTHKELVEILTVNHGARLLDPRDLGSFLQPFRLICQAFPGQHPQVVGKHTPDNTCP